MAIHLSPGVLASGPVRVAPTLSVLPREDASLGRKPFVPATRFELTVLRPTSMQPDEDICSAVARGPQAMCISDLPSGVIEPKRQVSQEGLCKG